MSDNKIMMHVFTGKQLIDFIFDMILDFKNPVDLIKKLLDSDVYIIHQSPNKSETAFLLLPACDCENCKTLRDIVLVGLKSGKTFEQLDKEIDLFKADCGTVQ